MPHRKRTYVEGSDVIEIHSPTGSGGIDDREADQHRFIVENWESFAAAAFEGYRRFGIGAVIVEEDAMRRPEAKHPFLRHMIWYATSFEAWLRQGRLQAEAKWLEEQMQVYDPHSACMFIFLREDETPRVYLVESTLKPSAALARMKAMLN